MIVIVMIDLEHFAGKPLLFLQEGHRFSICHRQWCAGVAGMALPEQDGPGVVNNDNCGKGCAQIGGIAVAWNDHTVFYLPASGGVLFVFS